MPMPKVTTSVVDLSTRVTSTGTYNAAIVIGAKKGPIDTPTLVTSQTDFLERFTPNEVIEIGWDTAILESYVYLSQLSNLYVVRAANTTTDPALYGGCHIVSYRSSAEHSSLDNGFAAITKHTPVGDGGVPDSTKTHYDTPDDVIDFENDSMIIYGSSQGAWNNDLAVSIITDPDKVKLDGAFVINVYKNKALVETWTCSLDPSLKNGYGVNCYAETVLNASNYIRADVNDNDDVIKDTSYVVKVVGTVEFENDVVTAIKKAIKERTDLTVKRIHQYVLGDIVKVAGIDGITGYYRCTVAGRTAKEEDIPAFVENDAYIENVVDGACEWELAELVKPYASDADFDKGEIAIVTEDSETFYYKAMISGTTEIESAKPEFAGEDSVEDGTITWCHQTQVETVSEADCYTYLKKAKGSTLDLTKYTPYSDMYLVSKYEMPETAYVENPITIDHAGDYYEVTYTATYTGEASAEHYNLPKATDGLVALAGGYDGAEPTNVERIRALKTLQNMNDINIQLIMDGGNTTPAYQRAIDDVCKYRENSCKGIVSTPYQNEMGMVSGNAQADVVNYRKYDLNVNTRNLALYTTHQLIYDEFNDRNVYVSPSAFVTARIMSVAQEYGWHWAAAGYNRGVINSLDVSNTFDPSVVDTFSDAQINTIIKEPGMGQVIFDELDLQSTASDLQDLHNSLYVDVYLRPRIKTALKSYLFEFNDEQTRMLITKMLETFMSPEVASRAIYDYRIVCDESNNKPRDIQNSICNVWIFLKLMKLAKWIPVKLIVTPYSVSFDDAMGSAA